METALHRLNREVDAIEEHAERREAMRAIAYQAKHWCAHCMGVGPESCMHNQQLTDVVQSGVPAHAACFFKDGEAWCCVRGDFINLQESPAGFGSDMEEALNALSADISSA